MEYGEIVAQFQLQDAELPSIRAQIKANEQQRWDCFEVSLNIMSIREGSDEQSNIALISLSELIALPQ